VTGSSSTPTPTPARALLRLGYACDNACVFCGQAGVEVEPPAQSDVRLALTELRQTHTEISFVGGEPALDPELPERIALARELGFEAIGLQTNGRRLASDRALFDRLVAAGLSDLQLSIHGPSAAAHDYHSGRTGSFDALIELMSWAQRAAITTVATTALTRSNFRELPQLPPALKRRGVAGWMIQPVRPYGRAADNFARVVPRFGMALPYALHALELARRHDLSAWIRGAPLCALGPFAATAVAEPADDARRVYPEPCRACPARARCPGVDPLYLEVFDAKELSPREDRPPVEYDEGRMRLIRMFVGVGTLLPRPAQLYSARADPPTPASDGKHRLPVLASRPTAPQDLAESDDE
jgi:organic radical activating enzyme